MKYLIWGAIGIFLYLFFRKKLGLESGEEKNTTIHHHHYHGDKGKKPSRGDEDYVDYEELKK